MTFKFEIEKNVPMPTNERVARGSKYEWQNLEVGDSVLIPSEGGDTDKLRKTIWSSLSTYRKRNPLDVFSAKVVPADETKGLPEGVRVWRMEDRSEDQAFEAAERAQRARAKAQATKAAKAAQAAQ